MCSIEKPSAIIEALAVVLQDIMQANATSQYFCQYPRLHQSNPRPAAIDAGHVGIDTLYAVTDDMLASVEFGAHTLGTAPTKFDSAYTPTVTVPLYLRRIYAHAKCSDACFVVALIYIDRIIAMHSFRVTSLNVHRIFLSAILLAAKFLDDVYYNNSFYAKIGGIPLQELNSLELEFLRLTRFDLHVSEHQYGAYHRGISAYVSKSIHMPRYPSSSYGDFSAELDMQWNQQQLSYSYDGTPPKLACTRVCMPRCDSLVTRSTDSFDSTDSDCGIVDISDFQRPDMNAPVDNNASHYNFHHRMWWDEDSTLSGAEHDVWCSASNAPEEASESWQAERRVEGKSDIYPYPSWNHSLQCAFVPQTCSGWGNATAVLQHS